MLSPNLTFGSAEWRVNMIRFLENDEKIRTRQLYEIAFNDTKKFVDYYYRKRIQMNRILVLEEENQIRAMLHLNPHYLSIDGKSVQADYIYAVATLPEYRRRGYMGMLFEYAFHIMKSEGKEFTYLIPEDASIYKKYGFIFVYSKYENIPYQQARLRTGILTRRAAAKNIDAMVNFCEILKQRYDIFTIKNQTYFKKIMKQINAEDGFIELMYEVDKLVGIRFVNGEGELKIVEEITLTGYETIPGDFIKIPKIMMKEFKDGIIKNVKEKKIFINEQV